MMQQPQPQYGIEGQSSTQSQIEQQQPSQYGQQGMQQQGQAPQGTQGYQEGAQSSLGQSGQQGFQSGTQSTGGQMSTQSIGGQTGTQSIGGQTPQLRGLRLDDALTNTMRVALHDFVQAVNVTEWCAEQCIDEGPEMNECLRLCRDVADLASLNVKFMARDSAFGPELVEVFIEAANACARECAQHQHAHCQECAEVLSRAVQTSKEMLASIQGGIQQGGQQPMQSPQSQMGQSPQSQMGQSPQSQVGQRF